MKRMMPMVLTLILLVSSLSACSSGVRIEPVDDAAARAAYATLLNGLNQDSPYYIDYVKAVEADPLIENLLISDAPLIVGAYDSVTLSVDLPEAALAQVRLAYSVAEGTLLSPILSLAINGESPFIEALALDVPLRWLSNTDSFPLDSYQDESLPTQRVDTAIQTIDLHDTLHLSGDPLRFEFAAGENTVTFTNASSSALTLHRIELVAPVERPSYAQYSAGFSTSTADPILKDAIRYASKNSSFIRLRSYGTPSVEPYSVSTKLLNVVDGLAWNRSGQALTYTITVEEAGAYALALKVLNTKTDYTIFRSIAIDGEIPFEEAKALLIPYTNGNWDVVTPADAQGEPYRFYLSKGTHTITLMAQVEPIAEQLIVMRNLIAHINAFALDIRKITGRDVDRNRTWKLTNFLPETETNLLAYQTLIQDLIVDLSVYAPNGTSSSAVSYLVKALIKIEKMLEIPDELPLYLDDLYSATGSVTEMIGNTLTSISDQALTLDGFAFYTDRQPLAKEAGFVESVSSAILSFINSFTSNKYVTKKEPGVLNVWVNRSILYVDTMQKLVDQTFTPQFGIKVKISVMPDANKLILANATNQAPDVALGLPSYMPYDFAVREAAYRLSDFPDFWEIAGRMPAGAMVPYVLNENVYALPETVDFHALIYRKDIFASLDLTIPDTWQDVIDILPELQRYGMNFYHLTSGGSALKYFYQTSPFIYQFGGNLYDDDGYSSAIDTPQAVAGLKFMTDLFSKYAIPEQVASFYNGFRFGSLPIGMADIGVYLQIKNAASELTGLWGLSPYPGIPDENGVVQRWDIVNGTAGLIFKSTEFPEESWEFMKWWTSTPIQTQFAYDLQSTYGPEYVWLSSNLEAVQNAPIEAADKQVIIDQLKWINDVPRLPGQYMLERGLSDIWNSVVLEGTPIRVAIDEQKISIDREIKRKMIEFGYLNPDGSVAIPYVIRGVDWIQAQIDAAKGGQ